MPSRRGRLARVVTSAGDRIKHTERNQASPLARPARRT
jgi:hypothetical protein